MSNNQDPNKPKFDPKGKPPFPKMKKSQTITFWVIMLLMIVVMYQMSNMGSSKVTEITYTEFEGMYKNRQVAKVEISQMDLNITATDKTQYKTYLPMEPDTQFISELTSYGVDVKSQKPSTIMSLFWNILPVLVLIIFWFVMMRGIRGGNRQAFSFGKSRAKLASGGKTKVTFKDVAGVDEAKEELEEIVDFLKAPKKFQRLGGKIPRGVLLLGRPGTGKTLLAKAVAGEAGVPFYSISGSDFVEMFVGVGASRVRDMFAEAKKNAPCIAFIDEIDAVGRHRGSGLGGGHDEREQTLNQLLVEMDGFEQNDTVIIIAATNRPDVLDPALLRPGRFDRQVIVDLPDIKGRQAILQVHARNIPIAKEVSFNVVARSTPGFSGADLANLINEAALMAARKGKKKIEMDDIEEAIDKVTMGKARKNRVISDEERRNTSVHEVGHVLCSLFQPKTEPIHKVTIIPRGFTGGATHFLQTEKSNYSRTYLEQMIAELLGGRAAEEVAFGELTTGASNDIERATNIARNMVCHWGMSSKIGPLVVAQKQSEVFLGKDISSHDNVSEETAKLIDQEIHALVETGRKKAMEIITRKRDLLDKMAAELLEKETLNAREIYDIALQFVEGDEKEALLKKFEKVKEIQIDTEKARIEAEEKAAEEKAASIILHDPSTLILNAKNNNLKISPAILH
jgi:cell division protease FtsH